MYIYDMAFTRQNGLTVQDAIDTTFLDTVHFDAECTFPRGFEDLNKLAITNVSGLRPFIITNGELKTPEFTIEAYVSLKQHKLLQDLYMATVHPSYIDERWPVVFMWGDPSDDDHPQVACYLSDYQPPESIDYKSADVLPVKLVLRQI